MEDLNVADELALLPHTQEQMQVKTSTLYRLSESVGMRIQFTQLQVLKTNAPQSDNIQIEEKKWSPFAISEA